MASTLTLSAFTNRVLRRLNEASDSTLGELVTGTGGSPTTTTTAAIQDYATEAASILARTCLPLRAAFTLAVTTSTVPRVAYQDLSAGTDAPAGAVAWQALLNGVSWTPTSGSASRLVFCTESALSLRYPTYLTVAPGTPTNWFPLGGEGIGLYPGIGNSGTLTAQCFYVPPAAAGSGVMLPSIPDDIVTPYVEAYVCGMLALKNLDDAILAQRASVWMGEFDTGRRMLYERMDPATQAYFPPLGATVGAGGN